jgi:hypothetical protein
VDSDARGINTIVSEEIVFACAAVADAMSVKTAELKTMSGMIPRERGRGAVLSLPQAH